MRVKLETSLLRWPRTLNPTLINGYTEVMPGENWNSDCSKTFILPYLPTLSSVSADNCRILFDGNRPTNTRWRGHFFDETDGWSNQKENKTNKIYRDNNREAKDKIRKQVFVWSVNQWVHSTKLSYPATHQQPFDPIFCKHQSWKLLRLTCFMFCAGEPSQCAD